MAERTIELTVISAKDLKKVVKFGKQTCYAVAYIDQEQTKKTKKDDDGGTDPTWNQKLELKCDEQKLLEGGMVITVEMYSDGTFSDTLIGTVTIPISDIAKALGKEDKDGEEKDDKVKEKEFEGEAQYLAFEVHRTSGKPKGVLNVAVKLGEKKTFKVYQNHPTPEPEGYCAYGQRDAQSSFEPKVPYQTDYPAPPPPGYPNQYSPLPYGGVPPAYEPPFPQYGAAPPNYGNQYPPQQMPYYPQQPAPYYPQQPPPYYQQQPSHQGGGGSGLSAGGGMALGLGAGLVGGAVGGLLVADMVDDFGDDGDDGDF